ATRHVPAGSGPGRTEAYRAQLQQRHEQAAIPRHDVLCVAQRWRLCRRFAVGRLLEGQSAQDCHPRRHPPRRGDREPAQGTFAGISAVPECAGGFEEGIGVSEVVNYANLTFTSGPFSKWMLSMKRTLAVFWVRMTDDVRVPSPKKRTPFSRAPSVTPVAAKMSC